MAAIEPLCTLLGISPGKLNKMDYAILEIELFTTICTGLKENFRDRYANFFHLMRYTKEMEEEMLNATLLKNLITEILQSKHFTIEGILYETKIPEEVLHDILVGKNKAPSVPLFLSIIDIHRKIYPDLYQQIIAKIFSKKLSSEE